VAGGIKIPFLADVRSFLTGTKQVEKALDDTADSLDDLAHEAQRAGDDTGDALADGVDDGTDRAAKSVDKLEKSFRDLARDAKASGDKVGDSMRHGTDRATEGVHEIGRESESTAKESAASFSGSADDIADAFQEVAANAFAGFGPAGAVAGVAAAAGIGFTIAALQKAADEANALKDRVLDLAGELSEVGGDFTKIDAVGKMREWGLEVKDVKSAWEFWQKDSTSNFELMERAAGRFGLNLADLFRGMSGSDASAATRSLGEINKLIEAQRDVVDDMPQALGGYNTAQGQANAAELDRLAALRGLHDELVKNSGVTDDAIDLAQRLDAAIGESAAAAEHAADVQAGYADAMAGMADPVGSYEELLADKSDKERAAAQATADHTKSGTDSWEDYADAVSVSIDDMIADLDAQIAAAQAFETNLGIIAAAGGQALADELRAKGPEVAASAAAVIAEASPEKLQTYITKYGTATGAATTGAIAAGITAGQPAVAAAVAGFSNHVGSISIPVHLDTSTMSDQLAGWRAAWVRKHGGVAIPTTGIAQPA
jgi:archaellum component FlaC